MLLGVVIVYPVGFRELSQLFPTLFCVFLNFFRISFVGLDKALVLFVLVGEPLNQDLFFGDLLFDLLVSAWSLTWLCESYNQVFDFLLELQASVHLCLEIPDISNVLSLLLTNYPILALIMCHYILKRLELR